MEKVRVALIGYGHLGKWHAQKAEALEQSELVAIVEMSEANQELAKKNHPNVRITNDLNTVIADIDAALVVTPTSFHFQIVKDLIGHQKSIFCEKPLTETIEQAKEIFGLSRNYQKKIQVGHSERFHIIWENRELIDRYVTPESHMRLERQAPFKGRATDVDVVSDLMIHDIDLMLHISKKRPSFVESRGHRCRTNHYDYVSSRFYFDDGMTCDITVGRNFTEEVRSFHSMNENGALSVDLFRNTIREANSNATQEFVTESSYEKRDHLFEEQKCFYHSILEDAPEVVSVEDGVNAIELIDAVHRSLRANERVSI